MGKSENMHVIFMSKLTDHFFAKSITKMQKYEEEDIRLEKLIYQT